MCCPSVLRAWPRHLLACSPQDFSSLKRLVFIAGIASLCITSIRGVALSRHVPLFSSCCDEGVEFVPPTQPSVRSLDVSTVAYPQQKDQMATSYTLLGDNGGGGSKGKWAVLITQSALAASVYATAVLAPYLPCRDMQMSCQWPSVQHYALMLGIVHGASFVGSVLAAAGLHGGCCVWAFSQWLLTLGLPLLVLLMFLLDTLNGRITSDGLESLLFAEMNEGGLLDVN